MEEKKWFFEVFNRDPLIIYIKEPWHYERILETTEPISVLTGFLFNNEEHYDNCVRWIKERQTKYKSHRYEVFCDTQDFTNWMHNQEINATFMNENSCHSESEFKIINCHKEYQLVYVAAAAKYKNLPLLKSVTEKTMWICGRPEDKKLYEEIKSLPHVETKKLDRAGVVKYLNKSRVGLCLSKQEGSMRASAEYALCGLPIVNVQTYGGKYSPSSCGREVLLTHCVNMKSTTPEGLKEAVAEALNRKCDPVEIREAYLEARRPHRQRFVDALNRACAHLRIKERFDHGNSFRKHCNFEFGAVNEFLS